MNELAIQRSNDLSFSMKIGLKNKHTNMARIIKFEKNDCAPCAQVSAYLDQKGIQYETVNPFDEPDLAAKFKIRTVPTVIVLENEEIQHRIIGFKPEELAAIAL
jgi:thioredoxin 1